MKAALCVTCSDIVTPYRDWQTNRSWRWCQCEHVGVRWRDGGQGLLEVSSLHDDPDYLRVIGFNNSFLKIGVQQPSDIFTEPTDSPYKPNQWRKVHDLTCKVVGPGYLFHADNRNCWAVIVRIGESGDVFLIDYVTAKYGPRDEEGSE